MRTVAILLFISLAWLRGSAQVDKSSVRVDSMTVTRQKERIALSFTLTAGERVVKRGEMLWIIPVVAKGADRMELPPILLRGRKAELMAVRDGYRPDRQERVRVIKNRGKTNYHESFPYQDWMEGSELSLDRILTGCTVSSRLPSEALAENILKVDTVMVVRITPPPTTTLQKTVAEKQAELFSFVSPIDEFERDHKDIMERNASLKNTPSASDPVSQVPGSGHVKSFVDKNKEGALMIFYTLADNRIDPEYRQNGISISQLIESVNAIENSADSRVARVVISGFASPDGALHYNEKLAWERALAVKQLVLDHTSLKEETIRLYNGAEDWGGLYRMVEVSNMEGKESVLQIIGGAGERSAKMQRLKQLDGGGAYRYLRRNLFPELRSAAYIKVYYENISF